MVILLFGDARGAICERESGGEIAGFLASAKTPVFDRPARGQRREQIARLFVAQRGRAGAAGIAGERIKIGHGESAPKAGRNRRGKSLGESFFAVFLQALALDAHCGDRAREQAVEPDRIVARFAKAEIAGLNAPQRAHDFAEQIAVAVALAQFDREFGFFAGAVVFVRDGVGGFAHVGDGQIHAEVNLVADGFEHFAEMLDLASAHIGLGGARVIGFENRAAHDRRFAGDGFFAGSGFGGDRFFRLGLGLDFGLGFAAALWRGAGGGFGCGFGARARRRFWRLRSHSKPKIIHKKRRRAVDFDDARFGASKGG